MKRASVALALGFSFVAAQGCMAEPMDESEIGSAGQAMCESLSYSKVMAALLVAMADEVDELHPTKYLAIQQNKYGWGIHGVVLTSAATAKCGDCDKMSALLELQNVTGIDPAVLNVPDYRSNLVSKLQDQINYENSQSCLPPAHTLGAPNHTGTVECGEEYAFTVAFEGGGGGGFEVTREAESYNANNRNGSQHNWTNSGSSMTIGPDWSYTWPSYSSAPNLSYSISFPAAGTYKVWLRGMGSNGGNDSAFVGINNTSNNAVVDLPENGQYGWSAGEISVPSAGTHNVHVFAREDGFFLDKLVVNQSSTPPSGSGGCPAPVPNDLKKRIDRFQVNAAGYVGFSADATSIRLDPDDTVDPIGGGSGSGSDTCSATPPTGGSDVLQMPYAGNEDRLGDCCWQNYVQKTYKRHLVRFLYCKN